MGFRALEVHWDGTNGVDENSELLALDVVSYWNPSQLRPQDSNLDLTDPKTVVLPLHQGGTRRSA